MDISSSSTTTAMPIAATVTGAIGLAATEAPNNVNDRLNKPLDETINERKRNQKSGSKGGKSHKKNPRKNKGNVITVGPSTSAKVKAKKLKKKNTQIKLVDKQGSLLGNIAPSLNSSLQKKAQSTKKSPRNVVMPTAANANLSINLQSTRQSFKNRNNNAHAERLKNGQEKRKTTRENKANNRRGVKMEQ